MLNATNFAALIPTQAFRAPAWSACLRSAEPFTFVKVFSSAACWRDKWEDRMSGADDHDPGSRGDDIPEAIANLGVIVGGRAVRPPANDNRSKPEPEATGSTDNRDKASTE
jgi:hypothetical protein